MPKTIKKLEEEFLSLVAGSAGLFQTEQAYLVGAAYEGHPTQEKALVFVFAGKEYLVPFVNRWEGLRVAESIVRLDRAERVVARPQATSQISEMIRTHVISPQAQAAILNGVKAWFVPEPGYEVRIVPYGGGG